MGPEEISPEDLRQWGRSRLLELAAPQVVHPIDTSTALLEADLLYAWALGVSRERLYTQLDKPTAEQIKKYQAVIERRLKREPYAYITGHREFYGLDFLVDRRVLIPRPETELLVERVIKLAAARPTTIIDVGTGSGAIIIAAAKNINRSDRRYIGLDI
jgi:release factor glutamine methyltransferase